LPDDFAIPAAYGDLATALQRNSPRALLFVWTGYIVGAIDRITALRNG